MDNFELTPAERAAVVKSTSAPFKGKPLAETAPGTRALIEQEMSHKRDAAPAQESLFENTLSLF